MCIRDRLLPAYKGTAHEKEYRHFHEVYKDLGNQKNIYFAQAYRTYEGIRLCRETEAVQDSIGAVSYTHLGHIKMNKTELVAAMADKTELSKKDAEAALKAFTDVVAEELKKGEKMCIRDRSYNCQKTRWKNSFFLCLCDYS